MSSQAAQKKAEAPVTLEQPAQDAWLVDPREYFDEWLRSLESRPGSPGAETSQIDEQETPTASTKLNSAAG